MEIEKLVLDGKEYELEYDAVWLARLLSELGIEPERARKIMARAVLYFSMSRNVKEIYEIIGSEFGIKRGTVAAQIKRSMEGGVYNGKLKTIDEHLSITFYDYGNGYSGKEFIAILNEYMRTTGRLIIKSVRPSPQPLVTEQGQKEKIEETGKDKSIDDDRE